MNDISKPLKKIVDPIDQLDFVLLILDNDSFYGQDIGEINRKIKNLGHSIEDKDLLLTLEKLSFDGNLVIEPGGVSDIISGLAYRYRITYNGKLSLKRSRIYRNKPYKTDEVKRKIETIFTISKTVVTISYSLIIVLIGYWGVKVTDKSNRLEDDLKSRDLINILQKTKIDSLTKVINDTTRLRTE